MSILKFENRTPKDLHAMLEYCKDEKKTDEHGIFGIGLNPKIAAEEMRLVQLVNNKDCLLHEYVQIIFAFDVGIETDIETLKEVCTRIGEVLVWDKRQVFGAIHYLDTDKIHCHYIINYVGQNGSLYEQKYSVVHYKKLVNDILAEYGFSLIKYYTYECPCKCPYYIDLS